MVHYFMGVIIIHYTGTTDRNCCL